MKQPGIPRSGFTLVELLVTLTVSSLLVMVVYGLVQGQARSERIQREVAEVRNTLSAGATLLGWELRYAHPDRGDLLTVGPASLTVRSHVAGGYVCRVDGGVVGVTRGWGDPEEPADSLLFFDPQTWRWATASLNGGGGSKPPPGASCDAAALPLETLLTATFPDALPAGPEENCLPEDWMEPGDDPDEDFLCGDDTPTRVRSGSPFTVFRVAQYGVVERQGHRWLARRFAGEEWEVLTGPLQHDGLRFRYLDADGVETDDPSRIVRVETTLRAESQNPLHQGRGVGDELTFRISLNPQETR